MSQKPIDPRFRRLARELAMNHGPRFPGLVQNLIRCLEEYERRLGKEVIAAREHHALVRRLIEDLKGWEFE